MTSPLLDRSFCFDVRAVLAGALLVSSLTANTQIAASTGPSDAILDQVVVTGSRISMPNDATIGPVTTVGAEEIQQSGVTRIEDLLNSLPQVYAGQSGNISNGSNGTAEVDLRGLGAQHTLVLINGRRLGPGDPVLGGNQSDLNRIPAELVDRVELLTGGASSTYGADAVAGVVNFLLNTHFEGVKLTANAGFFNHSQHNPQGAGDALPTFNAASGTDFAAAPSTVNTGAQKDLSFLVGFNSADDRGNATFYATYRNLAAVLQSKYDYSACTLNSGFVAGPNDSGGKFTCGGSASSATGYFQQADPITGAILGPAYTVGPQGLTPWSNAYQYNYGPLNYFQRPDERWTAGSFVHYELNNHADVYSELQYMSDRSLAQLAPTAFFLGTLAYSTCGNPLFTAAELAAWCGGMLNPNQQNAFLLGRRNAEGGPRQYDHRHQDIRIVIGSKGEIGDGWTYDAYSQYGRVQLVQNYYNDVSLRAINNSLNVIQGPSGPECAAVSNRTDPLCVPWNIWNYGGVSQAAVKYITIPLVDSGDVDQYVISGNISGDLGTYGLQLPAARTGLKVNLGAEWHEVRSSWVPDKEYQSGDCGNCGGVPVPPLAGEVSSRELFGEARLPILEARQLAKAVAFDTGYRFSDYSLGFRASTYKFGLEWQPTDNLRVRGSFARAVRAPNIGELYTANQLAFDGTADPCAGSSPSYTPQQCARTGVSASQYGHILVDPSPQYDGLTGGNTRLKPETALTTTFGIGYQPTWLQNFRIQLDYYDIRIDNVIRMIGADVILKECLGLDLFCNLVHRDVNGSLWLSAQGYIVDQLANVGQLQESGIDVDLSHTLEMGRYGRVRTALLATYMDSQRVTPIASDTSTAYNCVGRYGNICGLPVFQWRHTLRTTWETPWRGIELSLAWRHFGAVALDELSSNPNLAAPGTIASGVVSNTDAHLGARDYFDLSGLFRLSAALSLRLGIDNVLDRDPPVFGSSHCPTTVCNGNTFPQVYDPLGRYIFATMIARL